MKNIKTFEGFFDLFKTDSEKKSKIDANKLLFNISNDGSKNAEDVNEMYFTLAVKITELEILQETISETPNITLCNTFSEKLENVINFIYKVVSYKKYYYDPYILKVQYKKIEKYSLNIVKYMIKNEKISNLIEVDKKIYVSSIDELITLAKFLNVNCLLEFKNNKVLFKDIDLN